MKKFLICVLAAAVGSTVACDRDDTRETGREVREEAKEAGDAIERGAARLPDDDRLDPTTKDHEQYVGIVTRFTAGQTLSIETADGDNQSFDLDETGTKVNLPKSINKGSKVRVTVQRSGNQKTINVTPQG